LIQKKAKKKTPSSFYYRPGEHTTNDYISPNMKGTHLSMMKLCPRENFTPFKPKGKNGSVAIGCRYQDRTSH
jgi:hypothetical protein